MVKFQIYAQKVTYYNDYDDRVLVIQYSVFSMFAPIIFYLSSPEIFDGKKRVSVKKEMNWIIKSKLVCIASGVFGIGVSFVGLILLFLSLNYAFGNESGNLLIGLGLALVVFFTTLLSPLFLLKGLNNSIFINIPTENGWNLHRESIEELNSFI